jgi:phospholipid-binding lipoprotein MlaA
MNPFRAPCALVVLFLAGRATAAAPDPTESLNRKVFNFNERLDKAVTKPVAQAYHDAVAPGAYVV